MLKQNPSQFSGTDIALVPVNKKGNDFIIGDIHGAKSTLEAVYNKLGDNDRLFLVGDLTDRGEDSPGVIEFITTMKNQYPNKEIHVVRGNHEELCLASIDNLEEIAKKRMKEKASILLSDIKNLRREDIKNSKEIEKKYDNETLSVIHHSVFNGGEWLVTLFNNEISSGKIKIHETHNDKIITYEKDSKIKMIKDFMNTLPYIMHVQGDRPFNTVHADMPITDQELSDKINKGDLTLTKDQKQYATWAREGEGTAIPIKNKGKTENATITYVGHNIVDDENETSGIRETNTVDLDINANHYKVCLAVNHTKGECRFIGKDDEEKKVEKIKHLVNIGKTLNEHLKAQTMLFNFLQEIRQCQSVAQFSHLLTKWKKKDISHIVRDSNPNSSSRFTEVQLSEYASIKDAIPEKLRGPIQSLQERLQKFENNLNDLLKIEKKNENLIKLKESILLYPNLIDRIAYLQSELLAIANRECKNNKNKPALDALIEKLNDNQNTLNYPRFIAELLKDLHATYPDLKNEIVERGYPQVQEFKGLKYRPDFNNSLNHLTVSGNDNQTSSMKGLEDQLLESIKSFFNQYDNKKMAEEMKKIESDINHTQLLKGLSLIERELEKFSKKNVMAPLFNNHFLMKLRQKNYLDGIIKKAIKEGDNNIQAMLKFIHEAKKINIQSKYISPNIYEAIKTHIEAKKISPIVPSKVERPH